jgi:hypothetical protein
MPKNKLISAALVIFLFIGTISLAIGATNNPKKITSEESKNFTLPTSVKEINKFSSWPGAGWMFWEQVTFTDGIKNYPVPGNGICYDCSSGNAICMAHDDLYSKAVKLNPNFIQYVGPCHYEIPKKYFVSYEWTPPSIIHAPPHMKKPSVELV